jgi:organic radical activating enzyme
MTIPIKCKSLDNFYDINLLNGQIIHCCKFKPIHINHAELKSLGHNYFDLNSETVKARQDLKNGIKTPACIDCWEYEEKNLTSFRHVSNNDLSIHQRMNINLQISNLCNLACFYCDPNLSTSIMKYKFWIDGVTGDIIKSRETIDNSITLTHINDYIENSSSNVNQLALSITGGEPFMVENFDQDVLMLAETFLSKNEKNYVDIIISTNSASHSGMIHKFYESIKKHKDAKKISIEVILSLENLEERAEYIRYGLKWGKFEENFKIHRDNADRIAVRMTLNAFSIVNMVDFIKYFSQYNVRFAYNYVNQNFYRMNILDERFKSELTKVEDYVRFNNLSNQFEGNFLKDLKDHIQDDRVNADVFRKAITNIDSIRNTNWRTAFPEYIDWFDAK